MYIIFITDESSAPYRAKNAKGKTATFASQISAMDEAARLKAINPSIMATDVIYEGRRKK